MTDTPHLIHITPETHGVELDLVYATDRNFTGKTIYKEAHALLLAPAEARLRKAVELAESVGMKLRIFDAYRPPQAQKVLWDFLPDPTYVAELGRGSNHSRGTALDLTLIDSNGEALDMGTGFDAMVGYLKKNSQCRVLLVEKTDRLYRNFRDWVTIDESRGIVARQSPTIR